MKLCKVATAFMVAVVLAAGSVLPASALVGAEVKDPNLEQAVSDSESYAPVGEQRVLTDGHVDLGPVYFSESDSLALLARDDTGDTPVWRNVNDVVFNVGDTAQQVLPEGDVYDFTGATAGETVWALPQTQVAGVPWLGWNTQHPQLVQAVDRGVTFEFLGHQGAGDFTVFLQAGGFGEPQVLWTSTKPQAQSIWVDALTHTHANWVFTKPGAHLVKLRVKASLQSGKEISAEGVLRFAVGAVKADEVFVAQWQGSSAESADSDQSLSNESVSTAVDTSFSVGRVTLGLGVGAVALLVVLGFFFFRGRKAQATVFSEPKDS